MKRSLDLRRDDGDPVIAALRSRSRTAITESVLRREVARDLEQLMNSIALESTEDLREFPAVSKSILNFGFPDLAHRSIDEADVVDVALEIKAALTRYEPRLLPASIRVRRDEEADKVGLKVRFVVNAQLFCNPIDVPVEFVADVEYDSGKIAISRV